MTSTFIHTADWQLGKAFGSIEDLQKRSLLQQERISAIHRIGEAVRPLNCNVPNAGNRSDAKVAGREGFKRPSPPLTNMNDEVRRKLTVNAPQTRG
jgi:hypothetical protein